MKGLMPIINMWRAAFWRMRSFGLHPMSPYTARAVLALNAIEGPRVRVRPRL